MSAATVVCVIGTPRSGTSLTARILNLAGVYLGPESEMRPAGRWNPKGFWENRRIAELNRRLLESLDRDDLTPPRVAADWAASGEFEAERVEAQALISDTFAGHRLWGWKEAGTTLVLPFWQQLLPDMRYVICLRNPIDVAASAERIEAGNRSEIFSAWGRQAAAALAYTAGRPRILVSYDDYLDARRQTIERLWRFIGNETPPSEVEARQLEEPIDEDLLHHRTPAMETLRNDSLPLEVSSTYLITELLRQAIPEPWRAGEAATRLENATSAHAHRMIEE